MSLYNRIDDDEVEEKQEKIVYKALNRNQFLERFRKFKAFYSEPELSPEESLKKKNKNRFIP